MSPPLAPVFATAAILVVVTLGASLERWYRESREPLYRGGEAPVTPGAWDARLAVEPIETGSVRLSWAPATGADTYAIVFLSADLVEIARVGGVRETALALTPGALPPGLASGTEVLWRVVALRGDEEVASSPTTPVAVP